MGNWNMTIQGVGPHGNGIEADIEQIFKRVLEEVKANGHIILHSSVTAGGAYFDPATIPPIQ